MIVKEIAKFENPLHARGELLLVAELGQLLGVAVRGRTLTLRHGALPFGSSRPTRH